MTEPTPTSPTGGSASTTNYQYDRSATCTQTAAPLGRTTSSTYDGNGNKISDTDARGNVTGYKYDPSTGSSKPTILTVPNPPRLTTSATTSSVRPIRTATSLYTSTIWPDAR
jgi:YD repeat-containing protein